MKAFKYYFQQILTILCAYNLNLRLTVFDKYILVDFH